MDEIFKKIGQKGFLKMSQYAGKKRKSTLESRTRDGKVDYWGWDLPKGCLFNQVSSSFQALVFIAEDSGVRHNMGSLTEHLSTPAPNTES